MGNDTAETYSRTVTLSAGYTSGEKKIEDLRQAGKSQGLIVCSYRVSRTFLVDEFYISFVSYLFIICNYKVVIIVVI